MSTPAITIKRHNHLFYHCTPERRLEMLKQLITSHADQTILIAVSKGVEALPQNLPDNVSIMSDDEIMAADDVRCDVIIHADLPLKALHYIKRLSCATDKSVGILTPNETSLLYPIESLLGRSIMQKELEGFELPVEEPEAETTTQAHEERPRPSRQHDKDARPRKPREHSKDERRPRYEERKRDDKRSGDRKPFDNKEKKSWENKPKRPSKYIGTDENGKPMFSGKTGERNHRHDGTPRTEEEKAEMRRRKKSKENKPYGKKRDDDFKGERRDKKPYGNKRDGDRKFGDKPKFDKKRDERSDNDFKGKKPFNKSEGKKSFDKKYDDNRKKPFENKRDSDRKKSYDNKSSEPKRQPKNFGVKTLKKDKDHK